MCSLSLKHWLRAFSFRCLFCEVSPTLPLFLLLVDLQVFAPRMYVDFAPQDDEHVCQGQRRRPCADAR